MWGRKLEILKWLDFELENRWVELPLKCFPCACCRTWIVRDLKGSVHAFHHLMLLRRIIGGDSISDAVIEFKYLELVWNIYYNCYSAQRWLHVVVRCWILFLVYFNRFDLYTSAIYYIVCICLKARKWLGFLTHGVSEFLVIVVFDKGDHVSSASDVMEFKWN